MGGSGRDERGDAQDVEDQTENDGEFWHGVGNVVQKPPDASGNAAQTLRTFRTKLWRGRIKVL